MKHLFKKAFSVLALCSVFSFGLNAWDLMVDESIDWDAIPDEINIEDILRDEPAMPVFLKNSSSIAMVANYWYNGREVVQLIPAGQTVPLGLWNKINFRRGQEPRVYRYNDFGAKIFGERYKLPFNIGYEEFIKGKQYGNAVIANPVLELSFTVSPFFNKGFDVRLLLRPQYSLNAQKKDIIFPNYSACLWRRYIGLGPSMESAAESHLNARRILNLPDQFAQYISVAQASERVSAAAEVLADSAMSGGWVAPEYENSIIKAINQAEDTLIKFINEHGDTINLIEWKA